MLNSFDPSRPDFAPYGLTCVLWTPAPMPRPNHHNEIELNMVIDGALTYTFGGSTARVEKGSLAVFWAAIPHQVIACEKGTKYYVATVPFSWFLQFKLPSSFLDSLQRGYFLMESLGDRLGEEESRFGLWQTDLEEGAEEGREIVLIELQARLMRFARRLGSAVPRTAATRTETRYPKARLRHLDSVERMACFIAQRYLKPITAKQIGEVAGLHPNYAMTVFKRFFGMSFVEYITFNRITHAKRLLLSTDLKVPHIAESSGFMSISRFNEAFRAYCGQSPRAHRKAHVR